MDQGGEILLPLQRRRRKSPVRERGCYLSIEQGGSQFDRVTWQDARVEAVEPTRVQVVPGAILDDHMIVNAIALPLLKGSIGDLVHTDRTRCRLVQLQGIPRQTPPPVGPRHRITAALDLSQCGEQFRSNN